MADKKSYQTSDSAQTGPGVKFGDTWPAPRNESAPNASPSTSSTGSSQSHDRGKQGE